ncbi:MAG: hypothetical protein LBU85_03485 [Treponema sp.]|jgi:hypothetical protein|nr:hypothetical protein [Treponema sp.]
MNNTATEKISIKVLWAAIEDYAGLWEAVWEFGNEIPPVSFNEIQTTVLSLFSNGYIELFRCKEPYGELVRITDGCIDILSDKTNWNPPELFAFSIRISATESGKSHYETLCKKEGTYYE